MAEDVIDQQLKAVDDALIEKDLKTALKICKEILQTDQENYRALVKIGLILLKRELEEQAIKAFRKATMVAPQKIEAWYHLLGYYLCGDSSPDALDKLIPIYVGLLKAETDVFSWQEHINNFINKCSQKGDLSAIVPLLIDVVRFGTGMKLDFAIKALQKLSFLTWPDDQLIFLKDVYAALIEKKDSPNYQLKFLKALFKLGHHVEFFYAAEAMSVKFPSEIFPLKQLCKGFYKLVLLNGVIPDDIKQKVNEFADKLILIDPKQEHDALITKGVDLYLKGDFFNARFSFNKAVKTGKPESWWGWLHLARSHLALFCYKGALYCSLAALSYLEKSKTNPELKIQMKILIEKSLIEAACNCDKEEDVLEGRKVCLKKLIETPYEPYLLENYCVANLTLNQLDIFNEYYKRLQETGTASTSFLRFLEGSCLKKSGKFEEAAEILKSVKSSSPSDSLLSKTHILLGDVSYQLKEFNDAHQSYLVAAKLCPHWFLPYYNLGCYYMNVLKNWDKARRCFQKAYEYNPFFTEAGKGLSDAYNKLDMPQKNIEILLKVASNSGEKWAWVRLGRLYSITNQYQQASDCYLKVLKANDQDSQCWELLAVSYSARGMFHAAIKSFERASDINPDLIYAKYRAATIKLLIGRFDEALDEFRVLVNEDSTCVPYLKGLAETCVKLAQVLFKKHILVTCKDRCQEAVNILCRGLEVADKKLCCLWKLMGDICCIVAKLPSSLNQLIVPTYLTNSDEIKAKVDCESITIERSTVLDLASRSYWEALRICENEIALNAAAGPLLYDLTYSYNLNATLTDDSARKLQLREQAFEVALKCIGLDDQNIDYWNILGTIAMSEELKFYDLAQHAFITMTEINGSSAVGWSNLGVLYLVHGNYSLAHRMFQSAQDSDPNHVSSWIGQAMIAENVQVYDALDLFRHAVAMEYHPESTLGFADFVCYNLSSSTYKSNVEQLNLVPVAIDCLTQYIMHNESELHALNLLGILLGKSNSLRSSLQVLRKALSLCGENKEAVNAVKRNLCNTLMKANSFSSAISLYSTISDKDPNIKLGFAQAYLKDGQYDKAYSLYRSVYGVLKKDDDLKGHLLLAMASAAYQSDNVDDAEAILYECLSHPNFAPKALIALGALSLLEDENLNSVFLVLRDLGTYKVYPEYCSQIALLNAFTKVIQGNLQLAKSEISSLILRWPNHIQFWLELNVTLLYCNHPPVYQVQDTAISACVAMYNKKMSSNLEKSLTLTSLSFLAMKNYEEALFSAQKLVLRFPLLSAGWMLTIAAFYLKTKSFNDLTLLVHYISSCECSDQERIWFNQFKKYLSV